jgi:CDP-diacylglycerol--glycerol-3-phosphate 3-phosphatidyltransferase
MKSSGLYAVKPWFVARLHRVEDMLVARAVSPDALTFGAVVVSVVAGATIAAGGILHQPLLWLAVPPLGVIRLALNALDGSVARRLGVARPFGAAINEIGDRVSDLALFAPLVAVSPAWLVVSCIAAMSLTSTAGVMSLAITGGRYSGGPMGKADRVAILGATAPIAALAGTDTAFSLAIGIITVGCGATTILRLSRLRTEASHVR